MLFPNGFETTGHAQQPQEEAGAAEACDGEREESHQKRERGGGQARVVRCAAPAARPAGEFLELNFPDFALAARPTGEKLENVSLTLLGKGVQHHSLITIQPDLWCIMPFV